MLHLGEGSAPSALTPVAFVFVAVVLAAACSVDLSKLRARPLVDSGAKADAALDIDVMETDAADAGAREEVDALLDHPSDQAFDGEDSFVGTGVDGASTTPEVDDVAQAEDLVEEGSDARADLLLGTGGMLDNGGAGGAGGGGAGGMAGIDDAAATGGTGGTFDTGGAGGTDEGGAGGMTGIDDAATTGGTGGGLDAGWAGGADGGGAGGMSGLDGPAATGGTVTPPTGLVAWWKMDEAAGSGTAVDATGNGNNATLTGLSLTSAWTTGHTGSALKCDGSGGASVNDSASLEGITTGVTISAWVYRSVATTGFSVVLSKQIGTTSGEYYWLGLSGNYAGTSGSSGTFASTTAVPIGVWTHMAATNDGSTERIYVNGAQVASKNTAVVLKADTSKLIICGNQNDSSGSIIERWNGLIDDLQLYNRALTATEISSLAK